MNRKGFLGVLAGLVSAPFFGKAKNKVVTKPFGWQPDTKSYIRADNTWVPKDHHTIAISVRGNKFMNAEGKWVEVDFNTTKVDDITYHIKKLPLFDKK